MSQIACNNDFTSIIISTNSLEERTQMDDLIHFHGIKVTKYIPKLNNILVRCSNPASALEFQNKYHNLILNVRRISVKILRLPIRNF